MEPAVHLMAKHGGLVFLPKTGITLSMHREEIVQHQLKIMIIPFMGLLDSFPHCLIDSDHQSSAGKPLPEQCWKK